MTSAARRYAALLLVSPVASIVLTVTTAWAFQRPPQQPVARPSVDRSAQTVTVRLRAQLRAASKDLQRSEASAVRLGEALHGRSARVLLLDRTVHGLGAVGTSWPASGTTSARSTVVTTPPPPVAVPVAPPVSTTTGAS